MSTADKPWPGTQPDDVLTQSAFHKALLLFHIPAGWTAIQTAAAISLPLALVTVAWLAPVGLPDALLAAGLLALFVLFDAFLFAELPRRGLSFGPWQPQLMVMLIPRVAVALLAAVLAIWPGPTVGWAALIGLELLGTAALVWGATLEPFRLRLTELSVSSTRLPPGAAPIRLLHISDLHIERLTGRENKLLALVEDTPADLIVITGDYLNLSYTRDAQTHQDVRWLLARLSAPHGVYAVLGSPPVDERDVTPALFADLPVQLLVDLELVVDLGAGRSLVLLGMDCSHHLPTDERRLRALVARAAEHGPQVLLYHPPDLMPQAAELGIDLYLCGHTHGGQVRLPIYGALLTSSQLGKRYEMGHYRQGQTDLYVSRGVGLEGLSAPRVRFLAPPEITLVTIAPADPASS